MNPVEKNAWLWAETNRLILDGLTAWNQSNCLRIRFEEFFADMDAGYAKVRSFLNLTTPLPEKVKCIIHGPVINKSRGHVPTVVQEWSEKTERDFFRFAGKMMKTLAYA